MEDGIKLLYVIGENPAVSDANEHHTKEALEKVFLVVQDIFLTETAELADVVFPAACFAEKDGTFANSDRTVQRIRKAVSQKGLPDWEILMNLSNVMGYKCYYDTAEDIFNEMKTVTPQYAGITYERLAKHNGLTWPVPTLEHPGTPILHIANPARGKGAFQAVEWVASPEYGKLDYPISMTTNRVLHHYHTRSMTGKNKVIDEMYAESYIMINPDDAKEWNIESGDYVRVSSPRGSIRTQAMVTDEIKKSTACMPFHWPEAANVLTDSEAIDPICKIPGLKLVGVKIEKD
jgi:formate dehydrogenase major subunit